MVCQNLETIWLVVWFFSLVENIVCGLWLVIIFMIYFTSEKNHIGFSAFRRGFPKWECSQRPLLPLNRSWFQGLQTLFQSNNLSKTKKMKTQKRKLNRMLLCLRNFLRWRTSQDLRKKFPQRSWMHTSANLSFRYKRKTCNNKDYEPSSVHSLMASFERHLKKKNSTFLSKALINRQPWPLQKLRWSLQRGTKD